MKEEDKGLFSLRHGMTSVMFVNINSFTSHLDETASATAKPTLRGFRQHSVYGASSRAVHLRVCVCVSCPCTDTIGVIREEGMRWLSAVCLFSVLCSQVAEVCPRSKAPCVQCDRSSMSFMVRFRCLLLF